MAWEEELFGFFEDLEAQAEAGFAAERAAELADRSRAEYQQVTLPARMMASVGREVQTEVRGVGALAGELERVCEEWFLLRSRGQDWIVRHQALMTVAGASERAVPAVAWSPITRLGLGSALRRLADRAERCVLHLIDGTTHEGILRRVGADFAELLTGEGRRELLVAYAGLAAVQSRE
ncbi:hypothetical protein [Nocardioides insulae]|uniref:hypothetical protein n=1 Tax=Nocardioides insulae TaxID=394734 RepID=UPI00040B91FC|nr:hypothetical protein [Nocardioides insulae]